MEKLPLISVIVPVYKVEPYLDRCVESIVNQTYSNLEIILVDDGSPDHCPAMCDAWAAKDSRVRVIHKANGGLSDARNAGMAAAGGELMGFVDSDDWISPDMYQRLYENMKACGSDISACGVKMVFEDGSAERMLTGPGSCVLTTEEAMLAVIEETRLKQPVWYKLYQTKLVKDIPFPAGKYHEDVFWTYQAVGRAGRVSVFDAPCYFYAQRSGSIMGAEYSLKRLDGLEAKSARVDYLEQRMPSMLAAAKRELWFSCMYAMQKLLRHDSVSVREQGSRFIHELLLRYPICKEYITGAGLKSRIWLTMARRSFDLTCRIRNLLRIGL